MKNPERDRQQAAWASDEVSANAIASVQLLQPVTCTKEQWEARTKHALEYQSRVYHHAGDDKREAFTLAEIERLNTLFA